MDKIGEKLQGAREARKLSIKEISKDTNISAAYLEALEAEEFDKIPGETYLLGFLRVYAEYLKLDGDQIVQEYKGYKIGESATPLEELTKPTMAMSFFSIQSFIEKNKKYLAIAVGVILIILLIWLMISLFSNDIEVENEKISEDLKESALQENSRIVNVREILLTDDKGSGLAYVDETVKFLVDSREVMFFIKEIGKQSAVIQLLPDKQTETLEIETPKKINVKSVSRDIILTLKVLTENRAKIAIMLGKKPEEPKQEAQESSVNISESVTAQNVKDLRIVLEAEFTSKTYVEVYVDGVMKKGGLIQGGTRERWDGNELIQLKIGNAGGIKPKINGKDFVFGLSGQPVNKMITWQKDPTNPNLYHIVVKDWK